MATNTKHVGRTTNNRKVVVAYRVIPEDPDNCLVIMTESLEAAEHDALINLVDSQAGQSEYELATAMARTQLPDGRNMLAGFNQTGKLMKLKTSEINMTPNFQTSVNLAELNTMIAEQKGTTVAGLALQDPNKEATPAPSAPVQQAAQTMTAMDEVVTTSEEVLTDEALAAQYRSQADALFKEAKSLREQAEELVPTKRKTKSKESA